MLHFEVKGVQKGTDKGKGKGGAVYEEITRGAKMAAAAAHL